MGSVLFQATVACFKVSELPFDDPERMLDFGPNLGFDRFDPTNLLVIRRIGQHFALAGPNGDPPAYHLRFLFHTFVHVCQVCIAKDIDFLAVQQLIGHRDICHIGGGASHVMHQAGWASTPYGLSCRSTTDCPSWFDACPDRVHSGRSCWDWARGSGWQMMFCVNISPLSDKCW
ncbi:hypothetical protein CV_2318 [Chromobacterium violaceum ATCC 12472]|uniref:Uncharacterized protein n=1 Tax=Chromobacterium violaceum (strain ATCC 12472 / DSM 30191 / JCM 1249 / CCUG 213 / NBRC 12614 / NCIMB 9131 / NCTC 9757 / MK) TaxID=243365 RepID=Q7NVM4_CHRVO|nr:hypothetical protein CV_2318 [Chromobacterium violaceum ATCC 12472]